MNERAGTTKQTGTNEARFDERRARRTNFDAIARTLADEPSHGLAAWARTTTGVVVLLLSLQMVTGALLAFYYVPSAADAHATVTFIEKAVSAGSWIRALHYHGSQWLPLALILHLAQMLWRGAYRRRPVGWTATLVLLALVSAESAAGFSLPWDARGFYSTRVAASIAGGLPFVGDAARAWLAGGAELSTLTVSRLYALHVLLLPFLILFTVVARLFLFRETPVEASDETERVEPRTSWTRAQMMRNALTVALVFVALSLCAARWPAPLAPAADAVEAGYLPRPSAQFLWLFQLLKYLPAPLASLAALVVPGLLLGALAVLPFLPHTQAESAARHRPSRFGIAVFSIGLLLVGGLTALAYLEDARNPTIREQLARQTQQEADFRLAPFVPKQTGVVAPNASAADDKTNDPPAAYTDNCARCHGERGEGKFVNPPLIGISARPQRTTADLIHIINDPGSYGLEPRMPSFATKLTDEQKRAIAEWITTLK
ncbi:MAG TPA: cytochrome b N-terminal domain-containing protein [Pyrinomonadaceae bacterium]|nr:cytochrome b N-terminal domain-containing protein [Pyrinomonadaceae bacterium]